MTKFPPCPACGKKGLHHPPDPKWFLWKDFTRATCRFCHATFRIKDRTKNDAEIIDNKT